MTATEVPHILSAEQFADDAFLEHLLDRSFYYEDLLTNGSDRSALATHAGSILLNVFYEPSTRTSFSFRTAAARLGMTIIGTENAGEFSSAAKGESLEDTARVLSGNRPDVIVVRHPDNFSVKTIAEHCSDVPVINAGDGKNEHPTQTLLDVFTIQKELGRRDNLRIVAGGDIAGGRTIKSLLKLLGRDSTNSFCLVAPEHCNADDVMQQNLAAMPAGIEYAYEMNPDLFKDADVVYWTRTQTERGSKALDGNFILRPSLLNLMPTNGIIMHPLPRLAELPIELDDDPRARYFQQAENGVPTRTALLDWVLSR